MSDKIRCVVIDDEAIARTAIAGYVRKVDALELCGVFKNALEANDYLQKNQVDLLFLDIEMPKLTGIQFLRIFNKDVGVVFTTAYAKFALESFDFNVVDYLLKPISFDRFLQAVNKAVRWYGKSENKAEEEFLFLKEGTNLRKVIIDQIEYVETMQNYIRISTGDTALTVLMTLKDFSAQLPESEFIQTHRSYLVKLDKIESVEDDGVYIGTKKIPISKRSRAEVLRRIASFGKKEYRITNLEP